MKINTNKNAAFDGDVYLFIRNLMSLCIGMEMTHFRISLINFIFMLISFLSPSGWDIKISRIRQLQIALDYLKFDEIER